MAVRGELQKASAPDMDAGLREQASIMLLRARGGGALFARRHAGRRFAKMDEAARLQGRMPKPIGRPYPVKGADELYGELLLEAGRPKDAVAWFKRALVRTPNRSRAVLGLARAAAKAGDAAASRTMYARFLENWQAADPGCRRSPKLAKAALDAERLKLGELARELQREGGHQHVLVAAGRVRQCAVLPRYPVSSVAAGLNVRITPAKSRLRSKPCSGPSSVSSRVIFSSS